MADSRIIISGDEINGRTVLIAESAMPPKRLTVQIAAAHFGCKVKTFDGVGHMVGIHQNMLQVQLPFGIVRGYSPGGCRLCLTPVEKMGDIDAKAIGIMYHDYFLLPSPIEEGATFDVVTGVGKIYFGLHLDRNGGYSEDHGVELRDLPLHIADYLRSPLREDGSPKPVYDLGYGEDASGIQAGWATANHGNLK